MPLSLSEFRQQYPQYNDMSDQQVADNLHKSYYSDIPKEEFYKGIQYKPNPYEGQMRGGEAFSWDVINGMLGIIPAAGKTIWDVAKSTPDVVRALDKTITDLHQDPMSVWKTLKGGLEDIWGRKVPQIEKNIYDKLGQYNLVDEETAQNPFSNYDKNIDEAVSMGSMSPEEGERNKQLRRGNYNVNEVNNFKPKPHQELMQKTISSILPFLTAGGAPFGGAFNAAAENENIISGAAQFPLIGKTTKVAVKVFQKGFEKVVEGKKSSVEAKKLADSIYENKGKEIAAEESKLLSEKEQQDLFKKNTPQDIEQSKVNLSKAGKNFYEEAYKKGSEDYSNYDNGKYGQKLVFEPFDAQFFDKQYQLPRDILSPETLNMIDNTIGKYSEKSVRDPLTGELNFKVEHQKVKPTVKQYSDLSKELRDASTKLRDKAANNKDLTLGQEKTLRKQASQLDRLKKDIDIKIKKSVGEKGAAKYQSIQDFWKNIIKPMQNKPLLNNLLELHAPIKTKNFLESLKKEGTPELTKAFLEHPEMGKAIAEHDIMSVNPKNIESVGKLLEGDLAKHLPEDFINKVKDHHNNIVNQKNILAELDLELKKQGLEKARIEEIKNGFKKALYIGGAIAAGKYLTGIKGAVL